MKTKQWLSLLSLKLFSFSGLPLSAALPEVSNVTSSQRDGTTFVDIRYDVQDADGDSLKVRIEISDDGGTTYQVPAFTFEGDIGDGITPGTGKLVTWDAGKDWDGEYSEQMRVKVIASDAKGLPGLEWGNEVPPGGFLLGQDGGAEGSGPSRHVNIPWSYWLSKYEIRVDHYAEYLNIALITGHIRRDGTTEVYAVLGKYPSIVVQNAPMLEIGDGGDIRWNVNKFEPVAGMEDKPVTVTWFGAIAFAQHYGYDLPTYAEWEKAARGSDHDDEGEHQLYPWGNEITAGHANSGNKKPVGYYNGNQEPFGPDTKSYYGLYDVIGNVSEWTRTKAVEVETYPQVEDLNNTRHSIPQDLYTRYSKKGSYTYPLYRNSTTSAYSYGSGFRVARRDL
jgi:formylglycine-generating enzyme required for sulfatase activity